MLYSDVELGMNSVFQSAPPQARLPMFSGTSITPRCSPSGLMTQTPPGPGDPDVAALVALHPVGDAVLDLAVADVAEEQPAVRRACRRR